MPETETSLLDTGCGQSLPETESLLLHCSSSPPSRPHKAFHRGSGRFLPWSWSSVIPTERWAPCTPSMCLLLEEVISSRAKLWHQPWQLPCKKRSPRYIRPFTILRQINEVTYELQLPRQYCILYTFKICLGMDCHLNYVMWLHAF